ncbi:hypothetical protein D7W82_39485 [Corallococcus sp. CA049B]|uniref:hypothetical protein n=1 Tax=Corallococcus sp. CA049B TaxID=2316730 RepID=UPI000EA36C9C|nr:hypothetical protein [Corallococcus sp. CA049B]RKG72761.1 hypothetical protein D7W82_39485 [Corallococcus sp. CA049B]
MPNRVYTAADIESFKREAKKIRKREKITHVRALDRIAEREGYPSWWHLQKSSASPSGADAVLNSPDAAPTLVRFTVDPKDAESFDEERLAERGIVEDFDFGDFLAEQEEEPWEFSTWEQTFRFTDWTSKSPEEIVEKVRETFFFPPRRLWIGGKEFDIEAYSASDLFMLKG